MKHLEIAGRPVGPEHAPYVIAEMSGNHNGSLDRALAIIDAIADTGAHAVKLQTYTPNTMTLDLREGAFVIDDPASLWHGRSLHDLYAEAHTPWDWHPALFERAAKCGLACFSSPFDDTAVDLLEGLDAPAYKIASFENTDVALLRRVARSGRPVIVSTGMANLAEIHQAVATIRAGGNDQIVLIKMHQHLPRRTWQQSRPNHPTLAAGVRRRGRAERPHPGHRRFNSGRDARRHRDRESHDS